jgi:VanZ family protein
MKQIIQKINHIAIKHNLYLFLSIIFAIFIFIGSITPETGGDIIKNSGVPAHFISYFVLSSAVLLYISGKNFQKPFIKAALLAGSYGIFIEFVQFFIPYRHFEVYDMLINFTGAFLVFLLIPFKKLSPFRIN